jgi:DNA-directed RNA polymerase specialized sigma24 family protein
MSAEELEWLRESLSKLRKWERELLVKRFCEGYTIAMLAQETMFWSESTVRNRLTQALEHLRKIYRRTQHTKG